MYSIKSPENIKVALYIRVANEDNGTAQRQEEMLRSYAEEQGYSNVLAYVDNGVNGLSLDRPALNRLNDNIAAGEVDVVMVSNLSRISRNSLELCEWINNNRKTGVSLISVSDGVFDDSPENKDLMMLVNLPYLLKNRKKPVRRK